MRPEYVDLRAAIYSDEKELQRFRQVIVNCVLATDLDDAELQMTRKARWAKAFSDDGVTAGTIQPRRKKPMRRNNKSTDGVIRKGRAQPKPTASGGGMLAALREAASEASKGFMTRPKDNVNRKATIVLEHLLQAANISHCMQNWKVYLKWNERLFDENYEVKYYWIVNSSFCLLSSACRLSICAVTFTAGVRSRSYKRRSSC